MQENPCLPDVETVRTEYEEAAHYPSEFQKVKWASEESMRSRFELAMQTLPFTTAQTWLDVGCGPGTFQAMVRKSFAHVNCTGIELAPSLRRYAEKRPDTKGCVFINDDFMRCTLPSFDLITCIGVLQRTNFTSFLFFKKAYTLLKSSGVLFVDTKNAQWKEFTTGRLVPDSHLQWFTLERLCMEATEVGLQIIGASGFNPHCGKVVPVKESSTIYLAATKV